ncbi:tryptophan 7-halogenase [Streptomyces sp. NPDC001709]
MLGSVVVVGGGTSGWMTAAYLRAAFGENLTDHAGWRWIFPTSPPKPAASSCPASWCSRSTGSGSPKDYRSSARPAISAARWCFPGPWEG